MALSRKSGCVGRDPRSPWKIATGNEKAPSGRTEGGFLVFSQPVYLLLKR